MPKVSKTIFAQDRLSTMVLEFQVKYSDSSQCPEVDFNKISNSIHKTYIGLISILQGFDVLHEILGIKAWKDCAS